MGFSIDDLDTVVPYKSALADSAWHRTLLAASDVLADQLSDGASAEAVRGSVRVAGIEDAIGSSYECIESLVAAELDTVTPGDRGLGRLDPSVPRFGAVFRQRLSPLAKRVIGTDMEGLCIAGMAAALGYDALLPDGPSTIRDRPTDQLQDAWIAHFAIALEGASDSFVSVLDATTGLFIDQFLGLAEELEVLRPRKRKDRDAALRTALLLAGAGADFAMLLLDRGDRFFAGN